MKRILIFALVLSAIIIGGCGGGGGTSSGGGGQQQKDVFAGDSSIVRAPLNFPGVQVTKCAAANGQESWQLAPLIEGCIASTKPNKLFIGIGGNNVMNGDPDRIAGDISTMIDTAKRVSPGTAIYVLSILPKQNPQWTASVQTANGQIQSLCASRGVTFINTFSAFYDSSAVIKLNYYDTTESPVIHLNDAGYAIWINIVRSYV